MTKSLKFRMLSLALIIMLLAAMIPFSANAAVIPNPNYQWSNDPSVATVKSTYGFTGNLYYAKYDHGKPNWLYGGNGGWFSSGSFGTNITFSDKKSGENEYLSFSFSNANRPVYFAMVKYGGGAAMYYFPGGATSSSKMTVPGNQAISHVSFYYGDSITLRSLKISKEVKLNGKNGSYGPFAFEISFTTPASIGSFTIPTPSGATAKGNNVFTFSLNGGQNINFTGVPDGSTYTVTETDSKGAASVLVNGNAGTSKSGTVSRCSCSDITFKNIYNIPAGLTIAKAVTGNVIPEEAVFTFKLTLSNGSQPYTRNVAGATNNGDGTYTFTLTADGSVTFELPAGLAYTVEETDSQGASSTTWSTTPSGVIPAADISNPDANKILLTATNDFTVTGSLRVVKDWEPDIELPPVAAFAVLTALPAPSVTVELYEDGNATGRTLTLSADNDEPWTGYFHELDISKNYSVVETDVPAGYKVSYSTFDGFSNENDYIAEITVTNTEIPTVDAAILARKVVNGAQLGAQQFSFALYQGDEQIQTATNDAEGSIRFELSDLIVPENGLVYTLREIPGNAANWTYDTSVFTATVHADGSVTYSSEGTPTFVNTYTPPQVDATIRANKVVTGAALSAGQFTFALYQGDNQIQTATNDAAGNISFSLTGLTGIPENGLVYTIREIAGNAANWTYDTTVFTATVRADGSVTYSSEGVPTFTNTYTPPENPPQPNPVEPPVFIQEIETPLTPPAVEEEEEIVVPEDPTPEGGAETGDSSMALFAALTAFLGLSATGTFMILRRRAKKSR